MKMRQEYSHPTWKEKWIC